MDFEVSTNLFQSEKFLQWLSLKSSFRENNRGRWARQALPVTDLFGIFEKITKMGLAGTPCDRFICVFCTLCLLPDLQKAKQAKMSKGKDLFSHKGILEYLFLLCLS